MTIIIYTSDNYTYYTSKGGDSELLLGHINGGERKFYGSDGLRDITKLADAHGWKIMIHKVE